MNRLLSNIGNNINQVAFRANATGNVQPADLENIKAKQDEIWAQQKEILRKINGIMDVAK
jgi:transcriptional regulator of met regulon